MHKTYDLETALKFLKKQNEDNYDKDQSQKINSMDHQSYNQHLRNIILQNQ